MASFFFINDDDGKECPMCDGMDASDLADNERLTYRRNNGYQHFHKNRVRKRALTRPVV